MLFRSGVASGGAPDTSLGNLGTGDHQEWAVGVEFSVPLGFRRAHAAVSHAELNLMRERTVQREQQREVLSSLSGAWTDRERTWQALQDSLEQYLAARRYSEAIEARDDSTDDRRIDAVRRMYAAEAQFFRARAEYAIALKNVHFEKGSLLEYKDMRVHEQPSEKQADAGQAPATESGRGGGAGPQLPEAAATEGGAKVEMAGQSEVATESVPERSAAVQSERVAAPASVVEPAVRRASFWRATKSQSREVAPASAERQGVSGRARL